MRVTEEQLRMLKSSKTVEELKGIIKKENIGISPDQAEKIFNAINAEGEMSDDELRNVSGGFCIGNADLDEDEDMLGDSRPSSDGIVQRL